METAVAESLTLTPTTTTTTSQMAHQTDYQQSVVSSKVPSPPPKQKVIKCRYCKSTDSVKDRKYKVTYCNTCKKVLRNYKPHFKIVVPASIAQFLSADNIEKLKKVDLKGHTGNVAKKAATRVWRMLLKEFERASPEKYAEFQRAQSEASLVAHDTALQKHELVESLKRRQAELLAQDPHSAEVVQVREKLESLRAEKKADAQTQKETMFEAIKSLVSRADAATTLSDLVESKTFPIVVSRVRYDKYWAKKDPSKSVKNHVSFLQYTSDCSRHFYPTKRFYYVIRMSKSKFPKSNVAKHANLKALALGGGSAPDQQQQNSGEFLVWLAQMLSVPDKDMQADLEAQCDQKEADEEWQRARQAKQRKHSALRAKKLKLRASKKTLASKAIEAKKKWAAKLKSLGEKTSQQSTRQKTSPYKKKQQQQQKSANKRMPAAKKMQKAVKNAPRRKSPHARLARQNKSTAPPTIIASAPEEVTTTTTTVVVE